MIPVLFPGAGGAVPAGINIATVIDSVLPALGATSVGDLDWCSSGELYQWADNAAKQLASKAGVFTEFDQSTVTSPGQAAYTSPVGHIDTLRAATDRNLRSITVGELHTLDSKWQATNGPPRYFSMDANAPNQLTTYPTPIAAAPLSVLFHKFPAAITSGNPFLSVPNPVRGYLAAYVKAEARRKESDGGMPEMADHYSRRVSMLEKVLEHLYGPVN